MVSKTWTYIQPIIDAIVFSNIWIALAALSLFSSVLKISNNQEEFYAALTIFSSTFIAYNFLKLKGIEHVANESVFFLWMRKYKWIVYSLLIIAFISLIVSLYHLSILQFMVGMFCAFISMIYIGYKNYNLRHFWFFKTPIVAFVWAFFIVFLAFVDILNQVAIEDVIYIFLACFLLIEGLTIPFEIRDLKVDTNAQNLKTIPMIFGIKGTKYLAIFHLLFSLLFFAAYDFKLLILSPLILIAIIVVKQLNVKSSEYLYTFILDGLIVLTYPLIALVY